MIKERNNGIDLLRIVAMLMVVILHILDHGGILHNIQGALQASIYNSLYVISNCAVDIYALISGYVSSSTKLNISKIIQRWLQVFFYSFIIAGIAYLLGLQVFNEIDNIVSYLLPVTNSVYWYFTAYFVVMFISPLINRIINHITIKQSKILMIILIVLFSIIPTITRNAFYEIEGYSALWLVIMYTLGSIIKKIDLFKNVDNKYIICILVFSIFLTLIPYVKVGYGLLTNYVSLTVVVQAICYLILFSRIKIEKRIVNKISLLTFGSYLFHDHPIIRSLLIDNKFIFVLQINDFLGLLLVVLLSILILFIGLLVDCFRNRLFNKLKIDKFCNNLSNRIDKYNS